MEEVNGAFPSCGILPDCLVVWWVMGMEGVSDGIGGSASLWWGLAPNLGIYWQWRLKGFGQCNNYKKALCSHRTALVVCLLWSQWLGAKCVCSTIAID